MLAERLLVDRVSPVEPVANRSTRTAGRVGLFEGGCGVERAQPLVERIDVEVAAEHHHFSTGSRESIEDYRDGTELRADVGLVDGDVGEAGDQRAASGGPPAQAHEAAGSLPPRSGRAQLPTNETSRFRSSAALPYRAPRRTARRACSVGRPCHPFG